MSPLSAAEQSLQYMRGCTAKVPVHKHLSQYKVVNTPGVKCLHIVNVSHSLYGNTGHVRGSHCGSLFCSLYSFRRVNISTSIIA